MKVVHMVVEQGILKSELCVHALLVMINYDVACDMPCYSHGEF